MTEVLIPLIMAAVACVGLGKRLDVYTLLTEGAAEGLKILLRILPSLLILFAALELLRQSGGMDLLTGWLAPVFSLLGIPKEVAPLVLIRPFSGSAALAVGADIMSTYGADSTIGRTAAVMLGSTETTFYSISVYFGAANIKKTRYAIPAALIADLTGFVMASLTARWL